MPELKKKLQLKGGSELLLLHAPEEVAAALLEESVAVLEAKRPETKASRIRNVVEQLTRGQEG